MGGRARGFTLIELLIAMAIAVVFGALIVRTTAAMLHWTVLQTQRDAEHAAIAQLADNLQSEEDSAWAIYTPPTDLGGNANNDGHELDFFARDGKGEARFWAYSYDARAQTLTRYTYDAPGTAARLDFSYPGVTRFFAHTYPVTALQDPSSDIYSPLFAGASLQSGSVAFYPGTPIAGGNQITYVDVRTATAARELELSTQSAPSGFVVVLRYTPPPAPAPTATQTAALQSWPQFVELPLAGQALQTSWVPPSHGLAYTLNRLLGGSVADAALTPCATDQGRAFTDAAFTVPLANASAPPGSVPAGVTASTDSGGCITFSGSAFTNGMPNVALYEPGYTGTFSQANSTCGLAVKIRASYPGSGDGPYMDIESLGGSLPIQSCDVVWQGGGSAQTTTKYEISGCVSTAANVYQLIGIGASCAASVTVPSASVGDCGDKPLPVVLLSGPGVVSGTADNFSVTRTGSGSIVVRGSFDEKWQSSTKKACSVKIFSATVTFGP